MRKVFAFVKNHWLFLSLYSIIFFAIIICVNYNLENEVEYSERDIKSKASHIYGGDDDKGVCVKDGTSKSLVSYKLTDKPSPEGVDSSIYAQMYGSFNTYYVATNKPWNIKQYLYEDGVLSTYIINPCAVGADDLPPEILFDELYKYINEGYKVRDFPPQAPEDVKSTYHYYDRRNCNLEPDTLWYDHYKDRLFFTKRLISIYNIHEDYDKIDFDLYTRIASLILLETLLFALFWYLRKKMKGKLLPSLKILKEKAIRTKSTIIPKPQKSNNAVTDTEYEVLLHKINPINFMNPYDAEKVKIANDLYSALLKSRDNETIIRMIEEKAKKTLHIT